MKPGFLDRWAVVLAAAILALHVVVAVWAASGKSVTADEILYVTNGFFIDRFGDYRVQPENGVLPQRLHGLAACWTNAPVPALENNEYWRTSSNSVVCHQFFYETGHDHFPMLMLARALNTLFSVGAGGLVFLWARRLGGASAGLVATALYAADPNILAHAALATSDMAAVFFLLGSASVFWWQLDRLSPWRVAASVAMFGLACVAKYSAVLLVPTFAGLLTLRAWRDPVWRSRALRRVAGLFLAHLAGAVAIIWLCYGFKFSGFSPALPPALRYLAEWNELLPYLGWQQHVIQWFLDWKLLPEPFLYGYAWVLQAARARASFLAGETGIYGWTSFFPLAFAWKTTEALLAGTAATLLATARRWQRDRSRFATDVFLTAPLLLFCALYVAVSLTSHLNIGHRHILPVYPALFVAIGCWAASLGGRWRRAVSALLLAGQVAAAAGIAPHFLAYFNRLAGGPENGYRLLVDSSLDWGQDLPALRKWLDENNAGAARQPVFLSYFGSGEPGYYGIEATHLPFINGFKFPPAWYRLQPGLFCVSATMLQQVYSGINGEWSAAQEKEYRDLRELGPGLQSFYTDPAARPALLGLAPAERWESAWRRYDRLRFARLCHYLRARAPDGMAGYSILIYRVTGRELAWALDGDRPVSGATTAAPSGQ